MSGLDEGNPGDVVRKFGEVWLVTNSSKTIGPKGLKFYGLDGGHPGVAIMKFGEDRSKTLLAGLFFSQNFLVVVTTLCLSKTTPLTTNHKYVET